MQDETPFRSLDRVEQERRREAAQRWLASRSDRDKKRIHRHLRLLLKEQTTLIRISERRGFFIEGPGAWRQDRALRRKDTLREELREMIATADEGLPSGSSGNARMLDALDSWYFMLNFR